MTDLKLPELPEADLYVGHKLVPYEIRTFGMKGMREKLGYGHDTADYFSTATLQAYATAAVLAERERVRAEVRRNDDGTLDEVVGFGTFHLEQMDAGHWWMQLGPHAVHLQASRGIKAHINENEHGGDDAR